MKVKGTHKGTPKQKGIPKETTKGTLKCTIKCKKKDSKKGKLMIEPLQGTPNGTITKPKKRKKGPDRKEQ